MDPAMEAAHSTAIEPNTDFTSYETCVTESSDSSPATGPEPPASMPIESDWALIMEFTSADIFQHSPFGDVLNSLRSLSLSGEPWPNYVRLEWDADDEEIRSPPTPHLVATVDDLTLRRHRRYGRRCRRRTGTTAHRALDCHLII